LSLAGAPGTVALVIDALKLNGGERETVFPSSRFFKGGRKTARIHIDANGNLTNDGAGRIYGYDAANRLISVTQGSTVTGYAYDGRGRRVQQTLNGTLVKQWVWCNGSQPCEERDASNNVTKRFYARGEQINGANYYYSWDYMGSVREMTDSTGAIRARYDYDPYGRQTKISGDLDADFGFCEYYNDLASGGWATESHHALPSFSSRNRTGLRGSQLRNRIRSPLLAIPRPDGRTWAGGIKSLRLLPE
jgi:YD repeat-containing protein